MGAVFYKWLSSSILLLVLMMMICCNSNNKNSAVLGFSLSPVSRRDALFLLVGGGALTDAAAAIPAAAAAVSEEQEEDALRPIMAVVGANGRTGSLCVAACLERGIPVRALTRNGVWSGGVENHYNHNHKKKLLSVAACNVKDPNALEAGVRGCRGVIYAASASKKGGSAKEIDNVGVVAAANACIANNVERYVVLSSTAVTRPNSLGYKFTNVMVGGGIMDEKKRGEDGVIAAYKAPSSSLSSYSIIRPGGLEEPKENIVLGPSALEISQGDALAGIVSRADLAQVAVEVALSNAGNLKNAAFELYYTSSAQPCEQRFGKLLKKNDGSIPRLHGESYEELFRGIQPDGQYTVPA